MTTLSQLRSSRGHAAPHMNPVLMLGSTNNTLPRESHNCYRQRPLRGLARFQPGDIAPGEPLRFYAHEVASGRFEALESWCVANAVPFTRWSGGVGQPQWFAADKDDYVVIGRDTAERLGSIEARRALVDAGDLFVPPFAVTEAVS